MKTRFTIAALALCLSAPALSQSNPAPNPDGGVDAKEMRDRSLANYEVERDSKMPNPHEARLALAEFGSCIAKREAKEATRLLTMDFKDPSYRRGLAALAQGNGNSCANDKLNKASLRTAGLLFAGSLAEAMVESDAQPLAKRLAIAATKPATPAFSFTDKIAICVVRSFPDQVAGLLATKVDSSEETAALKGITVPMAMCAKAAEAKKPIEINPAGLRAMLATAAFRSTIVGAS